MEVVQFPVWLIFAVVAYKYLPLLPHQEEHASQLLLSTLHQMKRRKRRTWRLGLQSWQRHSEQRRCNDVAEPVKAEPESPHPSSPLKPYLNPQRH